MRRFIFILLFLGFCTIYYYATSHDENSLGFKAQSIAKNLVNKATNNVVQEEPVEVSQQAASSDVTVATDQNQSEIDLSVMSTEQLSLWVEKQSTSLDSTHNQTIAVETKLKAQARTLKIEQVNQLRAISLDTSRAINSRIFSAYLVTLNKDSVSTTALYEIANKELPNFGPTTPHSEAELRRTQELAIRYMQVDELAERAKTDVEALKSLKQLASQAPSPEVRAYATKALKQIIK